MRKAAGFLALLLAGASLFAQNAQEAEEPAVKKGFFSYLSLRLGASMLMFPDSDGIESDPMPILPSPHIGLGFPFVHWGIMQLSAELSLDIYWTHYKYSTKLARPVPAAIERRESAVIGPLTSLNLQAKLRISPFLHLRLFGGIAVDPRIVLAAEDLQEGELETNAPFVDMTREYFASDLHYLFPTFGLGFDFKTAPTFALGLDTRAWFPIYQEVGGEWSDGCRFAVTFVITFLNETPDKVLQRELDKIKAQYEFSDNDYAFVLHYLINNPPLTGISPEDLTKAVQKTYKRSSLYVKERAALNSPRTRSAITDLPLVEKKYQYDFAQNAIRLQ